MTLVLPEEFLAVASMYDLGVLSPMMKALIVACLVTATALITYFVLAPHLLERGERSPRAVLSGCHALVLIILGGSIQFLFYHELGIAIHAFAGPITLFGVIRLISILISFRKLRKLGA